MGKYCRSIILRCDRSEDDRAAWATIILAARDAQAWALDALLRVEHPSEDKRPVLAGLLARTVTKAVRRAERKLRWDGDAAYVEAIDAALSCIARWDPDGATFPHFLRATLGRRLRYSRTSRGMVSDTFVALRQQEAAVLAWVERSRNGFGGFDEAENCPEQAETIVLVAGLTTAEASALLSDLGYGELPGEVSGAAEWQRRSRYRKRIRAHEKEIVEALGLEKKVRLGA